MFIPQTYVAALFMMILSMICWGSWANTQKATGEWRFELFYWDYVVGILISAVAAGFTFGQTASGSPEAFLNNLHTASWRAIFQALAGGAVFNLANLMLVAAIAFAGLAVAFPVGIGLAMVIGSILNYIILPKGNPLLLFGGIALVCVAIVFDAVAYRRMAKDTKVTGKGILLSVLCGIGMGLFYPLIAKALSGPGHLTPYTVALMFALGTAISTIPFNGILMRKPITGAPVRARDYFAGAMPLHVWGIVGGVIWSVGTISNFVASYAQMVGPATSYSLGQGATMISAIWGVFIWKEFRGAPPAVNRMLVIMFLLFCAGLASVALAPVVGQ
jgi:glucose uptake protein